MEVEEHSLASYAPFIRPGDMVFDVGANRGRKTYLFRKLGAKVVAVEPLLAFGDEFLPEFWWKWGGDALVIPVDRAVSPERDVVLTINRFMPYVSSMDRRWMTESAHAPQHDQPYYHPDAILTRQVRGITLDGLIGVYGVPAFIKIDVEGAEDTVVATLTEPVKALNMEFHADWVPVAAMRHMDGLGEYQWNYCLDNRSGFVAPAWTDRDTLLDYLRGHLTPEGQGSWGDIYGRLA